MGAEAEKNSIGTKQQNTRDNNGQQQNNRNKNTEATGTGATERAGTIGNTDRTGATTGTGVSIKKADKISDVKAPEINIPEPTSQKKRGRPRKQSQNKNDVSVLNIESITGIIVSVSSIIASREGYAHWLITKAEAEQIAKPLSNIIANNEHLKQLTEHADSFALISACIMIFAPRLLITITQNKGKKEKKKNTIEVKKNDNARKSIPDSGRIDKSSPAANNVNRSPVFESIPTVI